MTSASTSLQLEKTGGLPLMLGLKKVQKRLLVPQGSKSSLASRLKFSSIRTTSRVRHVLPPGCKLHPARSRATSTKRGGKSYFQHS